jgi:hypothetical protein
MFLPFSICRSGSSWLRFEKRKVKMGKISAHQDLFNHKVDNEKHEWPGQYFQQALFCFTFFGNVTLPTAVAVRAAEANHRVDQAESSVDRAAMNSAEVVTTFGAERHEVSFYRR